MALDLVPCVASHSTNSRTLVGFLFICARFSLTQYLKNKWVNIFFFWSKSFYLFIHFHILQNQIQQNPYPPNTRYKNIVQYHMSIEKKRNNMSHTCILPFPLSFKSPSTSCCHAVCLHFSNEIQERLPGSIKYLSRSFDGMSNFFQLKMGHDFPYPMTVCWWNRVFPLTQYQSSG